MAYYNVLIRHAVVHVAVVVGIRIQLYIKSKFEIPLPSFNSRSIRYPLRSIAKYYVAKTSSIIV